MSTAAEFYVGDSVVFRLREHEEFYFGIVDNIDRHPGMIGVAFIKFAYSGKETSRLKKNGHNVEPKRCYTDVSVVLARKIDAKGAFENNSVTTP